MELIEIFQQEVDANLKEATRLVLELEQLDTGEPEQALTEALMRVFHTLKGAVEQVMEDVFESMGDLLFLLETDRSRGFRITDSGLVLVTPEMLGQRLHFTR